MTVEAMVEKVAKYLEGHPSYAEAMITTDDRYIISSPQTPDKSFILPIDRLWDEDDIVWGTVVFEVDR